MRAARQPVARVNAQKALCDGAADAHGTWSCSLGALGSNLVGEAAGESAHIYHQVLCINIKCGKEGIFPDAEAQLTDAQRTEWEQDRGTGSWRAAWGDAWGLKGTGSDFGQKKSRPYNSKDLSIMQSSQGVKTNQLSCQ